MYPGRINTLFGLSESAKSWIAMYAGVQEMSKGGRVLFLDFEDEPTGIIDRFRRLGAGDDDLENQLVYVHPDDPLADMQRSKFGEHQTTLGQANASQFRELLKSYDPTLILVDGMSEIYGLHGLDTNDATGTSIITSWMKTLCQGGRTTTLVIDHTGKNGGSPIGAHHKIAMVQGTALRVDIVGRPVEGSKGEVQLSVYKDRPGAVRKASTKGGDESESVAARAVVDSRQEGITKIDLKIPSPNVVQVAMTPEREAALGQAVKSNEARDKVLALFGGDLDAEVTASQVMKTYGMTTGEARHALQSLRGVGTLKKVGSGRWTRYMLNGGSNE